MDKEKVENKSVNESVNEKKREFAEEMESGVGTEISSDQEEKSMKKETVATGDDKASHGKKKRSYSKSKRQLQAELDDLKSSRDELIKEIAVQKDRYLRLAAEYDNYRKRTVREKKELIQSASRRVLEQILDIMDDFSRAIAGLPDAEGDDPVVKGISLVYSRFVELLEREGLEEIEAKGKMFDPNLHEAAFRLETDEYEDGIIAEVIKKGYTMGGKVFRPSMVGVYKQKEKSVQMDSPENTDGDSAKTDGKSEDKTGPME